MPSFPANGAAYNTVYQRIYCDQKKEQRREGGEQRVPEPDAKLF